MFETLKSKSYNAPMADVVCMGGGSIICASYEKSFDNVSTQKFDIDGSEYAW